MKTFEFEPNPQLTKPIEMNVSPDLKCFDLVTIDEFKNATSDEVAKLWLKHYREFKKISTQDEGARFSSVAFSTRSRVGPKTKRPAKRKLDEDSDDEDEEDHEDEWREKKEAPRKSKKREASSRKVQAKRNKRQ